MLVSSSVADEPPRKRNKSTAADVDDTAEKVGFSFLFSYLIWHRPGPKHTAHSLPWTSLDGR